MNARPPSRSAEPVESYGKSAGYVGIPHGDDTMDIAEESLSLATFQQPDFNVARIVSGLTDGLIAQSKHEGGAFNPQPFIDALDEAVDELIPLRKDVAQQTASVEAALRAAEKQYSAKVSELKSQFNAVSSGFSNLEARISEVSRATVRVGDELESTDRLRTRAAEARDIIVYYYDFSKGETTRIDALRKDGREGRAKVAIILRRLASVSKEIEDVEGGEQTREAIDKYCERFENDMLKLFDRYYRKGDPKAMAHCAKVLLDFNGGQSCIQIYVNQHDFFISKDRLQNPSAITNTQLWENLPDPNCTAPRSEKGLSALYDEIRVVVDQEGKIISAVFPNPPVVMQVFLQRVFAQVIQNFVEGLIETASSSTTLALLRMVYLARISTHSLIEDLKALDFFRNIGNTAMSSTGPSDKAAISVLSGPLPANAATIAAGPALILDAALEELFTPYVDKYVEREQKNLAELYGTYLAKFTKWHQTHSKAKEASNSNVFDRMVDRIAAATKDSNAQSTASSAASAIGQEGARGLKQLMKLGGINTGSDSARRDSGDSLMGNSVGIGSNKPRPSTANAQNGQANDTNEKDGLVSLEVAQKMLTWHAEAVGRMIELSPPSEAPKNAHILLRVLSDSYGQAYLLTALETSSALLATWEGKTEPPIDALRVVRDIDMVVQLWQRYVSTALMPLAGTSLATRREMSALNSQVVVRIENKVNQLVQRLTDAVTTWLSTLLSRQKKLDFKPKNDADLFESERTEPCAACCAFVIRVREVVVNSVTGKNQESLLTDIGVTFHSLLLEHFKKFPVGETGTILLTKDLAAYQDAMSTYGIQDVTERFEMLRQLGKLFEVQVDALRSFLEAEHLSRIDRRLLRPYIQLRADYDRYPKKTFDQIFGEAAAEKNALSKFADSVNTAIR